MDANEEELESIIETLNNEIFNDTETFRSKARDLLQAYINDDEETKAKVVKWFRGEYANKTQAKKELGVDIVISDDDWYEYLKLFASFFRQAGYAGLMIMIDELVNIYKIPNITMKRY